LRAGDRLVCALYVLGRNANGQHISGFDPELSRYNLGSVGIFHAISRAIAAGAHAYDFLRGAEAYKYGWRATDTATWRITPSAGTRQQVA
jgi:CelD/BcsL family acetyltransferase involved in cellulose biosynthesis